MNIAFRKLIDGERKYVMFRNSNSAEKKLLRNIKEVYRRKNMVSGRNKSVPLSGIRKHHFKTDF